MRIFSRRNVFLLSLPISLLVAALPVAARAAGPNGEVYFGYSRLGANTFYANTPGLNGWEGEGDVKLMPFVGADVDVAHYGLGAASSVPHTTTVLFGPRVTVGAAGVHLFVHGLVGWEHSATSGGSPAVSGGALAVDGGGGVDFRIAPFFAWRVSLDYLGAPTQSGGGGHDRFGTGLEFRF